MVFSHIIGRDFEGSIPLQPGFSRGRIPVGINYRQTKIQCMARFFLGRRVFFMISVIHLHSQFSTVAARPLAVPLLSNTLHYCKLPPSVAAIRGKASVSTSKGDNPIEIAANLVALLGSTEEVRSVNPDLRRELLACLRFLVPPPIPVPDSVFGQGFKSRKGDTSNDNWPGFESLGGENFNEIAVVLPVRNVGRPSSEVRKWRVAMKDERVQKLIWWPPAAVMKLALSAVEWGGDPRVIQQALNPCRYEVPDVEDCKKQKCQLTRTSFGRRFVNKELNLYMAFLFETIAALAPSAGFNVSLNRYDLFHGHMFLAGKTGRLGILFHAKEYPVYNKDTFPVNLGYCQTGSNLPYDDSLNLRNILWLAPLPGFSNKRFSSQWFAPGALVVLDAHPGGIIFRDLVSEWVQDVRTIYEDEFGDVVVDVNYLNVENTSPENKIFIC